MLNLNNKKTFYCYKKNKLKIKKLGIKVSNPLQQYETNKKDNLNK